MQRILVSLAAASFFLAPAIIGQNTANAAEPQELIARRAEYQRALSRSNVTPMMNYLRAIEPLKQQFTREGKLDAVQAVDAEIATIKQELSAAQKASDLTAPPPVQFQLDSAIFGDPPTKRVKDVTHKLKAAMDSGAETMFLDTGQLGVDPAPGTRKVLVVTYTINGRKRERTFKSDIELNFKKDLR